MNLPCSIKLQTDIHLLAFEDAFFAGITIASEKISTEEILFRGDILDLMKSSEPFALKIQENKYFDYYYNSWGFPSAHRSLQSAVWKIEDACNTPGIFNYFIIIQRKSIMD
jgi:hypothetical protein